MKITPLRGRAHLTLCAAGSALFLSACGDQPLDFDLRGLGGGFTTADAATGPLANRPRPDDRGVISYPNYQVAVARRGDTLADVAGRVGIDADQLARYNGIDAGVQLRRDEVIALPRRVAEPSPATGAATTGPIKPVDITSLAGGAIDRSPATPGVQTAALPPATAPAPAAQTGTEPVRHKVERGETAYTVARLYGVPVKALADWNGLGADFAVREGQFLLIPVPKQNPPARTASPAPTAVAATTLPGSGTPTPTPPSAAKPLPQDDTAVPTPAAAAATPAKPVADVGTTTKPAKATKMLTPVQGSIIRGYAKGRNEGINIKAADGAPVKAADSGTVAAITKSAEGIPIVVVRHTGNLLTVYANVTDVNVAKGDSVGRGQQIAKLRSGTDAYVHFEVRQGFDSVDPSDFIN
ncbi:LysM domain protein/M23/M37 peptidase [Sulfitobacter noctilucicola]|uniref:Murein DD-endopeptidase MepM/ murein hydrolase activator NlpD n=1 Tax=Sulfitobacter noctilucicola TaxID=1342301 RepID=A0A7W6M7Z8_9RHOB|nr:LysM peptidoglycan-binding domain-containing M23 family metallopeptidase [Sulfitobacter noctilucicola]KIN64730.1 LysM domain protein/M23/M37 peptidase [Sulfitobacter noctilucicola]MBB4174124.1 murein DD-endopeptidase MepM/ murein hydrolase activator NlpD [Sulfitobacter noctilucicola]